MPEPSEAQALAASRLHFLEHAELTGAPEEVIDLVCEALTWGWRQGTLDQRQRLRAEAFRIAAKTPLHR